MSPRRLLLVAALTFYAGGALQADDRYRVELNDWRFLDHDLPGASDPSLDDRGWKQIHLPANLARAGARSGQPLWLRCELSLSAPRDVNLALHLGPVYDTDEVYLNGQLIGSAAQSGLRGYGRPRLYGLPAVLLQSGRNVLAIKIQGQFSNSLGLRGAPVIDETESAQWNFWRSQIQLLTFAGLYLAVGIFFSVLHFKLPELREFRWFGILAALLGLQQFLVNESRFSLWDSFLTFKLLEQLCYVASPLVYFLFHISFFKAQAIVIGFGERRVEFRPRTPGLIYALISGAAAAAILLTMNPVRWDGIISVWFPLNLPFFVYFAGDAFARALKRLQRDAILLSLALAVMMLATVHFFAVERGLVEGPHYFSEGVLSFILITAFALTYRLIDLQMEVDRRSRRLDSVNALRDRVFAYIFTFVRNPARELIAGIQQALQSVDDRRSWNEKSATLSAAVDDLQSNLDDILELSRLEVISEPEFLEKVNFRDFITAVIPQGVITHHVKVHPAIVLNTSLELVNSLVIRLIDFPGFKDYRNIDLIITSDLKAHVHFRFMLFHNNVKQTRHLYDILTDPAVERGQLWVKWAIVREIIRILAGQMEVSIINRKFLRIDIELTGELPDALPGESRQAVDQIFIRPRQSDSLSPAGTPEALALSSARGSGGQASPPLPRFHARMTMGELGAYLRARFARRR
ncbi:MAG: 7TM-DISM domain-containing protein [Leptospirales bacterium]|nr:7TM-DISM domain-containing protein [Leptospirales bacterium]